MKVFDHIYETIGNTPLLRLHEIEKQYRDYFAKKAQEWLIWKSYEDKNND